MTRLRDDHLFTKGFLILDYGSQYTLLIARRLRELGYYGEICDATDRTPPKGFKPVGLILSGGPDSAIDGGRILPEWVLASGLPILGICYGLQVLTLTLGGKLRSGKGREYGKESCQLTAKGTDHPVFSKIPKSFQVWMSHGDDVESLPPSWDVLGKTPEGVIAAAAHSHKPILGLQFHPEVIHTQAGETILENFAQNFCKAEKEWRVDSMEDAVLQSIRETVGPGKVLVAVSGGVDSSVAATILVKALGKENVTAVFVDHGLLRLNEAEWVQDKLRHVGVANFESIDASELFLNKLRDVSDPEEKRKIIGNAFIEVFEQFAKSGDFTHLGQGTLYPDVIESAGHGAGAKVIKSHHNVGGLPEKLALKLVEPFRFLFKDEVRKIGRDLGLGEELVERHPFPGPGLAVRILGTIDREKIKILQQADHIFINALRENDLYDKVWQAFCVLLPVKTVGVMGDSRTYQWTAALRAVTATDGMTAGVGDLPLSFLTNVADQIVRRVDGINRVVYDVTSKPPSTIEWE